MNHRGFIERQFERAVSDQDPIPQGAASTISQHKTDDLFPGEGKSKGVCPREGQIQPGAGSSHENGELNEGLHSEF